MTGPPTNTRPVDVSSGGFTSAERSAMSRALVLAATPNVPSGPNPRVGCVLLGGHGQVVGEGFHRGAGTPHAEVEALASAGERARGATAVVTLEPCDHAGRTGPCSSALLAAGIRRLVYAQSEPNPLAAGGTSTLRRAGVEVRGGLLATDAEKLNRTWTFAVRHRRPFVTWKFAASLDGRSAAVDGSSRWISSAAARRDAHRLRALCDTVLVGTGTVVADDPRLTARDAPGERARQPLRAVMGLRPLPPQARVFDEAARTVVLRTRDPHRALAQLFARERRHVLLEGGPRLSAAFVRSGLVDEVIAYIAPVLLGSGTCAVTDLGVANIGAALDLDLWDAAVVGQRHEANLRVTLTPRRPERGACSPE